MTDTQNKMYNFLASYLTKGDVYAADAIAKISIFILNSRKELNMTQKEFAKKMGVTQGMVSKWESASYNFTIENIAQIADKLNMTFEISFNSESQYLENYRRQKRTEFTCCNEYMRSKSTLSQVETAA